MKVTVDSLHNKSITIHRDYGDLVINSSNLHLSKWTDIKADLGQILSTKNLARLETQWRNNLYVTHKKIKTLLVWGCIAGDNGVYVALSSHDASAVGITFFPTNHNTKNPHFNYVSTYGFESTVNGTLWLTKTPTVSSTTALRNAMFISKAKFANWGSDLRRNNKPENTINKILSDLCKQVPLISAIEAELVAELALKPTPKEKTAVVEVAKLYSDQGVNDIIALAVDFNKCTSQLAKSSLYTQILNLINK